MIIKELQEQRILGPYVRVRMIRRPPIVVEGAEREEEEVPQRSVGEESSESIDERQQQRVNEVKIHLFFQSNNTPISRSSFTNCKITTNYLHTRVTFGGHLLLTPEIRPARRYSSSIPSLSLPISFWWSKTQPLLASRKMSKPWFLFLSPFFFSNPFIFLIRQSIAGLLYFLVLILHSIKITTLPFSSTANMSKRRLRGVKTKPWTSRPS